MTDYIAWTLEEEETDLERVEGETLRLGVRTGTVPLRRETAGEGNAPRTADGAEDEAAPNAQSRTEAEDITVDTGGHRGALFGPAVRALSHGGAPTDGRTEGGRGRELTAARAMNRAGGDHVYEALNRGERRLNRIRGKQMVAAGTMLETAAAGNGGGSDPAALDLVFQRDARRYDGGFSLY